MKKILIIGQAPPLQTQTIPYDTTMLYDWLQLAGVTKEEAVLKFDFDAVSNEFPGLTANGQHKKPTIESARNHYQKILKNKIESAEKIIVLGNVARDFLPKIEKPVLYLMHPSKRNYYKFSLVKETLIDSLREFIS